MTFIFIFPKQFTKKPPLLLILGIPSLSEGTWDINPMISIIFFYLNSCLPFKLLVTPATGQRFSVHDPTKRLTLHKLTTLLLTEDVLGSTTFEPRNENLLLIRQPSKVWILVWSFA